MLSRTQLIALARDAAQRYQLAGELVCAVVEQESSWIPWSLRYEPDFYARYVAPLLASGAIAGEGEARARAFSWGLMQVMGHVARQHNFTNPSLAEICEPATGLDVGCRVLAAKLAATAGDVTRALSLWNGGANPDYPAAVLARITRYANLKGESE